MLLLKSLHIISMVTWFAGLFYLPRLFVYHAMTSDKLGSERFKTMERKLYFGIMMPSATLVIISGMWLWMGWGFYGRWLMLKTILVFVLLGYHFYCWILLNNFKNDMNTRTHVWYRWFNEIPVVFLILIVLLVELKPF